MKSKILSLTKSKDFKSILGGKKLSNRYSTVFFKKLSDKKKNKLNISFIVKKKIGNAVLRNKIKRRLRNVMHDASKTLKINLDYSYLMIAKKNIASDKYLEIKNEIFKTFR
jgi:ribonuclease P protein component, eubacterial